MRQRPIREPKPTWRSVPLPVRQRIEEIAGGRVMRGSRVWGGYGPSATFVLTLEDGGSVFVKGSHPRHTTVGIAATEIEERVYREIDVIRPWAPRFLGSVEDGPWRMLVLEDLSSGEKMLPWTTAKLRAAIESLAQFHRASQDYDPPAWVPAYNASSFLNLFKIEEGRPTIAGETDSRSRFLHLFADTREAEAWTEAALPRLLDAARGAASIGGPAGLVHMDVRSDNLIFQGGRAILLDWPYLAHGPVLWDTAAFFPSIDGEGGATPEEALLLYESALGVSFDPSDIAAAASLIAGFFATRAGLPDVPVLPRLRTVQKMQLFPSLRWAARLLSLPPPPDASPTFAR